PSRRVGRLEGSERDTVARQRGESAEGLAKRLRGDLDRITLQAIAERPAERYSSVANLADDVERFLADVPITAQAPTSAYLLRKLVRRHRGRVIAAALLMVSLLLGTVGTAIGFVKARAEAERASQEAEAARSARDDALAARSSSDLLADFFVDLFSSDSSSTTAGEVLARDTEALSVRLEGQPRTQGILLQRLAGIYAEWGDLAKADRLLEQAVTLLESADGAPFPETLDAYEVWISVRWKQARFREAGQLTEQALAFADRLEPPAGADRLAKVLGQGGIAMLYIARWNQAERWFQQGQTLLEGAPGDSPDHGSALTLIEVGLAGLAYDRGQWQEGIDRYRRTAQGLEQRFGPAHRRLAVLWPFIAYGEMKLGHLDEAERLLERSHELGERYWFDDGHKLAQILSRTALLYREQGRFAEAEALQRRSLKSRKEVLPATHPAIAGDLSQLAWTLWLSNQGRVDEVVEILEEARRMLVEIDEPVYPLHRDIPTRLGEVALAQGRAEDALSLFRQACAYIEGLEAPIAADLGLCHLHRGRGLWAMNRPEQARSAWEEAERQFEAAGAAPELAEVRTLLAQTPGST
ncbi:MAG: tetratricopeptide repeat protein, partial [Acidobacteriota bacterium]